MSEKIIIAGGTGFVGSYLSRRFKEQGFEVVVISRQQGDVHWSDTAALTAAMNGAACVINLAGRSINCRHNEKNKHDILQSRLTTTKTLGDAMKQCAVPPKLWVNASAAAFYSERKDRPNHETDAADATGFMADVCRKWEEMFFSFSNLKTRQIAMRITLILGKEGGVFPVYKTLTRLGLAGKQGSGKQMWSWIHIEDVFRMLVFVMKNESISGPVNAGSPSPLSNVSCMRIFRQQFHMPIGIPAAEWQIKIGAFFIGTESSLLLQSMWVFPQILTSSGFEFEYPNLEMAIQNLKS